MPTFLTNRRMHPALAKRIETSVRGRPSQGLTPRIRGVIRLVAPLAIVGCATWLYLQRRADSDRFAADRKQVVETMRGPTLGKGDVREARLQKLEGWLTKLAEASREELVSDELADLAALERTLQRPMVYLRGDQHEMASRRGIANAAESSGRDAFVLCLLAPPSHDDERHVLKRVKVAYGSGRTLHDTSSHVSRLHSVYLGIPFLTREWLDRVNRAADERELRRLETLHDLAPLDAAELALDAELLLAVLDEPGQAGRSAELDGERPHPVRIGLVDMAADKQLLVMRKHVDPSWMSEKHRARYARGMDSCRLALRVRNSIAKPALEK